MGQIWSDQRRYETWLLVEIAAAEAMASAGIVPPDAAREIRDRRNRTNHPARRDRVYDSGR
jgi:adenylosuccinate lyase